MPYISKTPTPPYYAVIHARCGANVASVDADRRLTIMDTHPETRGHDHVERRC